MSSWFDDIERQSTLEVDAADVVSGEGGEQQPQPAKRNVATISRSTLAVLGAVALTVAVTVSALWFLTKDRNHSEATGAQVEDTSSVQAAVNPDEQVAVAGQCKPEQGETTLSTADTSLRGVVAKWQSKYYDRDTSLTDYLTEESWLHDQDWEKVLEEGAPEGSSWCAVMAPVKDNSVDVDVMVTFADDSSQVYQQTVTGKQDEAGTWRIDDIEIR